MDPKPPQLNIKKDEHGLEKPKEKFKENPRAIKSIEAGKIHTDKFFGQTIFYIPQVMVDAIGRDELIRMVKDIYTQRELERVTWEINNYEHSLQFILPPQRLIEDVPGFHFNEKDQRIEQLAALIEARFK